MLPTTTTQLFLFLALVAPGLVFELLRERRRPALEETAFREASRIALASVVFNVAAIAVLAVVRTIHAPWMPDPHAWLIHPVQYTHAHYALIARTVLVGLVLATGFAALTDLLRRRRSGDIRSGGIWFQLFRADRPDNTVPWVSLRLTDGIEIAGFLSYYIPADDPDIREIALRHNVEGSGLQLRKAEDKPIERLSGWSDIVVRGNQISYFKVKYLPAASSAGTRKRRMFRSGGGSDG
jgi:hypothetical protein